MVPFRKDPRPSRDKMEKVIAETKRRNDEAAENLDRALARLKSLRDMGSPVGEK